MEKELQQKQLFKFKMNKLSRLYSTLFYIGYIKWIPGTIGSLISLFIIIYLKKISNNLEFVIIFFCLLFLAIKFIEIYSNSINQHDAKEVIIDEFLGIYLIIIFSNHYNSFNEIINLFLIFILFRIFDILKPFPINWIDKNMKNSYGIILDDIMAGIYTIIILISINAFI